VKYTNKMIGSELLSVPSVPRKRKASVHQGQTVLEILPDTLSEIAVQGLADDWIAPMIVDQIIEGILNRRLR